MNDENDAAAPARSLIGTAPADRGIPRFVAFEGRRIHVIERGKGSGVPLLLLPGGLSHARWWDFVAPHLAANRPVFAMDPLGHGDSDWLEPPTYAPQNQLNEIRAVASALGDGRRWIVVGHSHGGLLAATLGGRREPWVAGVVLVDIPPLPTEPRLMRAGRRFRTIEQPRFATREEALRSFRVFPDRHRAGAEVIQYLARESIRRCPDGSYTTKFDWRFFRPDGPRRPFFEDFGDALRGIECPALCIRGAHSSILSSGSFDEMAARIPVVEKVEIADATHHPHVENPLALADAVSRFAERVAPDPSLSPRPAKG